MAEQRWVYQLIVKGKNSERVFEVLLTEKEAEEHTQEGLTLYKTATKENFWLSKLRKVVDLE